MLTEKFVEALAKLATDANGPRTISPPGEPGHVYLLRQPDGSYKRQVADIGPANASASTLGTVAALAVHGESEVWVSAEAVVLLPSGRKSRDRVTMGLEQSTPLAKLREWDKAPPKLTQTETIRVLRTTLCDASAGLGPLLPKVRSLQISKAQELASNIVKNKISVDRSLRAEAAGMDDLPDEVVFTVPLFNFPVLPDKTVDVRCAFELDPQGERFLFDVMPGEIEKADELSRRVIADLLAGHLTEEGKTVPIYFGTP